MDDLTPAEILGRAADLLTPPLQEFVLLSAPGQGLTWEQYLAQRDRVDGRPQHTYSLDDPRVLLKILAFHWRHLDGRIRREQTNWAFEIHRALNAAAHDRASVTPNIARRSLENMVFLAEALVPLWSGRDQLAQWQSSLVPEVAAPRAATAPAEPSPPESAAAPTPAEAVAGTRAAGIAPTSEPDAPETPEVSAAPEAPEAPEESAVVPDEWEEVTDRTDLPEGIRRVRLRVGAALVEAVYFEAINYSPACQGILPLIELACENTGTEGTVTIDLLTLDIDGISMEDGAGHLRAITLQAGQRQVFGPRDIAWHLDDRAFASTPSSMII